MKLKGSLIVVSGASSGIGAALARALGAKGARVVLIARREERLREVAEGVEAAGGTAYVLPADLSEEPAATAAGQEVLDRWGVPDALVNNAGAGEWKYVDETEPGEAVQMMALPYFASFWLTRAVLVPMMARGSGNILMVNSPAWLLGWSGATGYAAARAAQHAFAEGLREDVHRRGLVVSEVSLSEVASDYFKTHPASYTRLPTIGKALVPLLNPQQAADVLVSTLERDRTRVMAPMMLAVIAWLHRYFPRVVRALVRWTSHKR